MRLDSLAKLVVVVGRPVDAPRVEGPDRRPRLARPPDRSALLTDGRTRGRPESGGGGTRSVSLPLPLPLCPSLLFARFPLSLSPASACILARSRRTLGGLPGTTSGPRSLPRSRLLDQVPRVKLGLARPGLAWRLETGATDTGRVPRSRATVLVRRATARASEQSARLRGSQRRFTTSFSLPSPVSLFSLRSFLRSPTNPGETALR